MGFGPPNIDKNTGSRSTDWLIISVNDALTDVGSFQNMPARYNVLRVVFGKPSVYPMSASMDVWTGPNGTGTRIVDSFVLSALDANDATVDATIASGGSTRTRTESALYFYNRNAQGVPATVAVKIVYEEA